MSADALLDNAQDAEVCRESLHSGFDMRELQTPEGK